MKNIFTNLVILFLLSLSANVCVAQVNCTGNLNVSLSPWANGEVVLTIDMLTVGVANYDSVIINPEVLSCDDMDSTVEVAVTSFLNGIQSECTVNITVEDKAPPVVYVKSELTVTLDSDGMASITPGDVDLGTFDNCDTDLVLSLSQSDFDISYVGQVVPVYLTAIDASGNSNSAYTLVTVLPFDNSVLFCVGNSTVVIGDSLVQLYPIDFVIGGGSNDYSMNLTDSSGNPVSNPIDPSYVGQALNVIITDNVFNTTCTSTLNVVGVSTNCENMICLSQLTSTLPGAGIGITVYTSDFLVGDYTGCDVDLFEIEILDTQGNLIISGIEQVTIFNAGTYAYVVTNPNNGNTCWGTLLIQGTNDCDILACVGQFNAALSTGTGVLDPLDCPLVGNLNGVGIIAEEIVASMGTNRCMEITVDNYSDIQAAQCSFKWDPEVIEYTGTQNYNMPGLGGVFNDANAPDGELLFVWIDVTGLTPVYLNDGDVLFEICFDIIGENGEVSTLTFDNDDIIDSEFSNSNQQILAEYYDCGSVTVGDGVPFVNILVDSLLEGNYNGCDLSTFEITVYDENDIEVASGIGSVTLLENGNFNYVVTDPETGNDCWGIIEVGDNPTVACEDVIIQDPAAIIDLSFVGITEDNIFEKLKPQNLIDQYGVPSTDAIPYWDATTCLIGSTYQDQVFILADSECSFKIIRLWTIINWNVYDPNSSSGDGLYNFTQVVKNIANCNYICDFLPNSTPFTTCSEGHSSTDDVEWPDDLSISDYRITPEELVEFSTIDVEDSRPEYFNEPSEYSDTYIDILLELQPNYLVVNRLWTVERSNTEVASYGQKITVDITNLDSLVSVTTWTGRAVPSVDLNEFDLTNNDGVAYVSPAESLDPSKLDESINGLNIKDHVMTNHFIFGLINMDYHQVLAGDFDDNGTLTANDLVSLEGIILGTSSSESTAWKFLDETDQLVNPVGKPKAHYIALKPGDVDDSAVFGTETLPDTEADLKFEDIVLNAGEVYEIPLFLDGIYDSYGIEFSLNYDASLINLTGMNASSVAQSVKWNAKDDFSIKALLLNNNMADQNIGGLDNDPVVTISFVALANTTLNEVLGMNPDVASYLLTDEYSLVRLGGDVLNVIPSGTNDVDFNEALIAFPNPASDYVQFKMDSDISILNAPITFYNNMGQKVIQTIFTERISTSSLSNGMYFYKIEIDRKIYSGNLMIIK